MSTRLECDRCGTQQPASTYPKARPWSRFSVGEIVAPDSLPINYKHCDLCPDCSDLVLDTAIGTSASALTERHPSRGRFGWRRQR